MNTTTPVIGAGSFGLVLNEYNKAVKLIYDCHDIAALTHEAKMQQLARDILTATVPEVGVPEIFQVKSEITKYNSKSYLRGLTMKYLPPPNSYNECVHITLGYYGYDINTSWGVETLKPVGPENHTRGFFADANHLEDIWAGEARQGLPEAEGSDMTIERLATIMGKATGSLVRQGFLPLDVEWIWSQGRPWLIDFGMCKVADMDPPDFLAYPVYGPEADVYIPKEGDEGRAEFMRGYLENTNV
jgi:hypothetical protein